MGYVSFSAFLSFNLIITKAASPAKASWKQKPRKIFVRSGIRTHAHIRGPEHSHSRGENEELSLLSLAP